MTLQPKEPSLASRGRQSRPRKSGETASPAPPIVEEKRDADLPNPLAVDPGAYNAVVLAATLRDLSFVNSRFRVNLLRPAIEEGDQKESIIIDDQIVAVKFTQETGNCAALVKWELNYKAPKQRKSVLVEASVVVVYGGLSEADQEVAKIFAGSFARTASYPYFRAYVAQVGSFSRIRMPVLPMMKRQPIGAKLPQQSVAKEDKASDTT